MLILLSPTKHLDFESPAPAAQSEPAFCGEASALADHLRTLSARQLMTSMKLSSELAECNRSRWQHWRYPHPPSESRAALYAYSGEAFQVMNPKRFNAAQRRFAQKHLRILSGLYGLLRPMDAIMPYRLEMAASLKAREIGSLYGFWRERLNRHLLAELKLLKSPWILNLASAEYSRAIDLAGLGVQVITPQFRQGAGEGKPVPSVRAKQARGGMCAYSIGQALSKAGDLQNFAEQGYRFRPELSGDSEWVFSRPG